MTDVLQCPHCDLRFTTRSELEQHKSFDHPRQEEAPKTEPDPAPVERQEPKEQAASPPERRGFLSRLFNFKRK